MNPLHDRHAGVLLHPTSLPGRGDCGSIGLQARQFIDFMEAAGLSVWQMLPLGPTHRDLSPYQCLSAHAGNIRLICLHDLAATGWLDEHQLGLPLPDCLLAARNGFDSNADLTDKQDYASFRTLHSYWLDDFALYVSIRQRRGQQPWYTWPAHLRDHQQARAAQADYSRQIEQVCFEQYLFFRQWADLRRYASERDIALFGDMPIYVAHDSADVWSNQSLFSIDTQGALEAVAGVPPDYFSATGQRWGNPLYRWEVLEQSDYQWWLERFRTQLGLFGLIRLDHFRGFEKYWEIAASADTAVDGRWVDGPGNKLFDQLQSSLGELPVVAEDLGVITAEVDALRQAYHFPGMKILQFAFDGSEDNPYLPQNHEVDAVVYTGTHDNDTTLGWYQSLGEEERNRVHEQLACDGSDMPWSLIETAMGSVARLAIIPMQDILSLGSADRMNTPGTLGNNWQWRFDWLQLKPAMTARLRMLAEQTRRL